MTQTPNVIGAAVMQLLKERGDPATPDNYESVYYELSGLPRPTRPTQSETGSDTPVCFDLLNILRQMVQDITDKTEHLTQDLGEKNQGLAENVSSLRSCRDKQEILRLLTQVVSQAGSIHTTVESSHKELLETRHSLTSMQEELAETRQLLNEDALTGALNRRGLDQTLSREIARAQRANGRLSLAMLDLDHFKKVNDNYGHEAGDLMLMHFTGLIRSVMRKSDALVRYGGEEFTLVLPDTDARGAHFVLGRLQQVMSRTPMNYEGKKINTTFSAGVATLKSDENGHALLRRADAAVYAAKNAGRNSIRLAQ
jgi:diguanylate cyclase